VKQNQQATEVHADSTVESDADCRQAWEKPVLSRLQAALAEANLNDGADGTQFS